MKDDGLEAYVAAIEGALGRHRGQDHALSPRDFALARGWYQGGVSLAAVLVGIDRAFETGEDVASLAYCRRFVLGLAAAGPGEGPGGRAATEHLPLPEIDDLLGALLERLAGLPPGARGAFEAVVRRIGEMRDLLSVSSKPNWDYLAGKLVEIDTEVAATAQRAVPDAERATYQREAARAVERHRGRVDEAALADARARYEAQRAREYFNLPSVRLG